MRVLWLVIFITPLLRAAQPLPDFPKEAPPVDITTELGRARKAWELAEKLGRDAASSGAATEQFLKIRDQQEAAYDEAKSAFRAALKKDPSNPQALAEFGLYNFSRKEYSQARFYLEVAMLSVRSEKLFTNAEKADYHRILGGLVERAGDLKLAMKHYETAMKLSDSDPRNRISLAIALCASGNPHEARAMFSKWTFDKESAAPDEPRKASVRALGLYTLALSCEELGFIEEALGHYNAAMKIAGESGDCPDISEQSWMAVCRIEDALDAIQEQTAERQKENETRKEKGLPPLKSEREEFARASYLCDEGIALKKVALSEKSFQDSLGKVRGVDSSVDENGKETLPSQVLAQLPKSKAYQAFAEAMQKFQEAIVLYPRLPRAHYELGLCNLWLGRFTSARTHLDAAALYSPNNLAILSLQGEVLIQLGQWEAAQAVFKKILSLEPESGRANLGLAKVSAALQDDSRVCQTGLNALERAVQLGAGDDPALRTDLTDAVERYERGEKPSPRMVLRGDPNRNRARHAPPGMSPWGGTIFDK